MEEIEDLRAQVDALKYENEQYKLILAQYHNAMELDLDNLDSEQEDRYSTFKNIFKSPWLTFYNISDYSIVLAFHPGEPITKVSSASGKIAVGENNELSGGVEYLYFPQSSSRATIEP